MLAKYSLKTIAKNIFKYHIIIDIVSDIFDSGIQNSYFIFMHFTKLKSSTKLYVWQSDQKISSTLTCSLCKATGQFQREQQRHKRHLHSEQHSFIQVSCEDCGARRGSLIITACCVLMWRYCDRKFLQLSHKITQNLVGNLSKSAF